jgi:sugar/nucleoside kinase (ribokinase family)
MPDAIVLAGNMILDLIKTIEIYPPKLSLTPIKTTKRCVGGAVCNCAIDLAVLDPKLEIRVIGIVGEDDYGDFIVSELRKYPGIDLKKVGQRGSTSFTDVMTEAETGARTFFTFKGADSLLSPADFDFTTIEGSLLHIGYIMLLDGMDAWDPEYGTAMARVLHDAQQHRLSTSIDVVSEAGDRFTRLVPPSLRFADYCTINENEAALVTGIPLRDGDGTLLRRNFRPACAALKRMGVRRWATIHAPEASAGIDESDMYVELDSLHLPDGYIQGTVGAGDAFTSGILYTALTGAGLADGIQLGSAIAACSLSKPGATEGVRDIASTRQLLRRVEGERRIC